MKKECRGRNLLFAISGMAFWFLMMPPTILGILMSAGVLYVLLGGAAFFTEKRKIPFNGKSIGLFAALLVLYGILLHGFVERWSLSSKIGTIADRIGMNNEVFIGLVAVVGILCSLYFSLCVISVLMEGRGKTNFSSEENVQWKINIQDVLICLLIAVIIGFELATAPFSNGYPGTDSAVFLYIGERMRQGAVPYLELFDHKGIILYFIEYLGLSISGGKFWGVWVLEVAGLFATALLITKIAALFSTKKETGYLAAFGALFIFAGFMTIEGGNVVEEYALPWITAALYIVLKYFKEDSYRAADIVWLGISFMVVFLLRANMITAWIAFLPVVFLYLICKKRYTDIGKCILWFVVGCAIIAAPVLFYFVKTGSLNAMIDCYFTFNFGYSDKESGFLPVIITMVYLLGETALGCLVLVLSGVASRKKSLWYLNFWFFIVSLLLASMSGRNYQHYGIMLVPAFIVPLILSADWILSLRQKKENTNRVFATIFVVAILLAGVNIVKFNGNDNISEEAQFIKENTSEGDEVLALGNNCRYYLESGRDTSNRFIYQTPPIDVSDKLFEEFCEELNVKQPVCIVVPGKRENGENGNYKKVLEQLDTWEKEGLYSCVEYDAFYTYLQGEN